MWRHAENRKLLIQVNSYVWISGQTNFCSELDSDRRNEGIWVEINLRVDFSAFPVDATRKFNGDKFVRCANRLFLGATQKFSQFVQSSDLFAHAYTHPNNNLFRTSHFLFLLSAWIWMIYYLLHNNYISLLFIIQYNYIWQYIYIHILPAWNLKIYIAPRSSEKGLDPW